MDGICSTATADGGPADSGRVDGGGCDAGVCPSCVAGGGTCTSGGECCSGTCAGGSCVGVDAGEPNDAGMSDAGSDGGPPDSGSADAGPPSLTLEVVANPNSVLTAYAVVSWTSLTSVVVQVQTSGGPLLSTPVTTLSGETSPLRIPILPLQARTTYQLQAVATESGGGQIISNPAMFTTGALPSGVPTFGLSDGGVPPDGYTLIARIPAVQSNTPEYLTIANNSGSPVWYFKTSQTLGGDFQQQPDGTFTIAQGGVFQQIDEMGNTVRFWTAVSVPGSGATFGGSNNHEFRLQPNGDVLLFGYFTKTMDLTAYGGASDAGVGIEILERVTPSGGLAFSWDPLDAPCASTAPNGVATDGGSGTCISVADYDPAITSPTSANFDLTHTNAIDVMADGNYLVSMRNMSQIVKIDSSTGRTLWRLGGSGSNFTFPDDPLNGFSGQHGARELPNGDLLLFDDGNGHTPPQSRAVQYHLDMTKMTANLVWSAEDNPPFYTVFMGFTERLANGNTLITYGQALHVQEVDPSGTIVWDLFDSARDYAIYRAFRLTTISPYALTGN